MTDDIVTRLRNHVRGDYEKTAEFMLGLAADEIENLREQNEYLKSIVNTLLVESRQARHGIEDMYKDD